MNTKQQPRSNAYSATYSTGDVLKAADLANNTLQTWIRRGFIIGHSGGGVEMPGRPGVRRRFSFHNLIEIAIATALSRSGMEVAGAFKAAHRFAHSSDGDRLPALPFPEGRTLLCVANGRAVEVRWKPGEDWHAVTRVELGRPEIMTVLDVSDLFDRAIAALELHPQRVIDDGYAPSAAGGAE